MTPTDQIESLDVLIVGRGAVGLSIGLALAQLASGDLRVLVLDRAPVPEGTRAPSPRAVALTTATMRYLDGLGAWNALRPLVQPVSRVEVTDSALENAVRPAAVTFDLTADEDTPTAREWPMAIVREADLAAALEAAARATPGLMAVYGADIAAFEATEAHGEVRLTDGRRFRAPLVVAADGRDSQMRRLAGIGSVAFGAASGSEPQTGIVTLISHELEHHGVALQHFLPGGPFAVLPLPGNLSCITWSERRGEAIELLARDDAAFLDAIETRLAGRLGRLALVGRRGSWPLERHLARELGGPRLVLVGDAARSVHPIAGQGLNLGFQDAAALVDCTLDAAKLGLDVGSDMVVSRYTRWRRADATRALAAFEVLNGLFSRESLLERAIRGIGTTVVDRLPMLKANLMYEAQGLRGAVPSLMRAPVSTAL